MNEMAPLLPILLVWLCFGFLFRKIQAAGKKARSNDSKTVSRKPTPDSPVTKMPSAPVAEPSLSAVKESLPAKERLSMPYLGSLGVDTGEGKDPCHEDQFRDLNRLRTVSASQEEAERPTEGLSLSWAGSDIVRGFVYGEILNRKKR